MPRMHEVTVRLNVCGDVRTIDDGPAHWIVGCFDEPDHQGPHRWLVTWAKVDAVTHPPATDAPTRRGQR